MAAAELDNEKKGLGGRPPGSADGGQPVSDERFTVRVWETVADSMRTHGTDGSKKSGFANRCMAFFYRTQTVSGLFGLLEKAHIDDLRKVRALLNRLASERREGKGRGKP